MPASPATASTRWTGSRATKAMAFVVVAIACLSGCGKSKAERDAEKAATDARIDAAATAEQEREAKATAAIEAEPVVLPEARPAQRYAATAAAVEQAGAKARAAASGESDAPAQGELRDLYKQMMGNVRNNVPRDDSVRFYDTYMNASHTAVCGTVDYELQADGKHTRSKRQRFIGFPNDAVVDTDVPGVHETFVRMAAAVDCSPDLYNYSSYSK